MHSSHQTKTKETLLAAKHEFSINTMVDGVRSQREDQIQRADVNKDQKPIVVASRLI